MLFLCSKVSINSLYFFIRLLYSTEPRGGRGGGGGTGKTGGGGGAVVKGIGTFGVGVDRGGGTISDDGSSSSSISSSSSLITGLVYVAP
jgi:hypothetical protein